MSAPVVALAIEVEPERVVAALGLSPEALEQALARALALCGLPGATSIALVDDATMRTVNRDYHDCDEPTDVLAFPLGEPGASPGFSSEIVVSLDTAEREAAARGVAPLAEVALYVVHGCLHLLGYDDHDPGEALKMHARTLEVLHQLGYENTIGVDE